MKWQIHEIFDNKIIYFVYYLSFVLCDSDRYCAGCRLEQGEQACHDKTVTSLLDVPEEVCDLNPVKTCRFSTRLVPHLSPTQHCTTVPKEVCTLKFTQPRQVSKPLRSKWCLDTSTGPAPDTAQNKLGQNQEPKLNRNPNQSSRRKNTQTHLDAVINKNIEEIDSSYGAPLDSQQESKVQTEIIENFARAGPHDTVDALDSYGDDEADPVPIENGYGAPDYSDVPPAATTAVVPIEENYIVNAATTTVVPIEENYIVNAATTAVVPIEENYIVNAATTTIVPIEENYIVTEPLQENYGGPQDEYTENIAIDEGYGAPQEYDDYIEAEVNSIQPEYSDEAYVAPNNAFSENQYNDPELYDERHEEYDEYDNSLGTYSSSDNSIEDEILEPSSIYSIDSGFGDVPEYSFTNPEDVSKYETRSGRGPPLERHLTPPHFDGGNFVHHNKNKIRSVNPYYRV